MDINEIVLSDEALRVIDDGVWIDELDDAPGVRLLVTGLSSDGAQKLMRQKQAAIRTKNRNKPLSDEQITQCTKEVLAEAVLKGWDGLTSNGEPVPYSQELATRWLLSRNGAKFQGLVAEAASRVDRQASELAEEIAKN